MWGTQLTSSTQPPLFGLPSGHPCQVISLFTKVPTGEVLHLLSRHFDEATMRPFHHILTSSIFSTDSQFAEHTDRVVMGFPLSPVIAHFFPLLVLLYGWHVHNVATWTRQAGRLPWPSEQCPYEQPVNYEDRKTWPHTLPWHWYIQQAWWLTGLDSLW
jgi:hypothetical protein